MLLGIFLMALSFVVQYFIFSFVLLDLHWFLAHGLGPSIARGLYVLTNILFIIQAMNEGLL